MAKLLVTGAMGFIAPEEAVLAGAESLIKIGAV